VTVVVLLLLILFSRLWVPFAAVWVVGPILEKVVDLVLAFFVFKALNREAERYRAFQAARSVPPWRN
jgi:hypothetical protein